MSTPHLARATEALVHEFGLLPEEAEGMHDDAARAAVSAALHDPDDPESLWLYGAAIDAAAALLGTTLLTESYIVAVRAAVDAVRAAILGEAS